MKTFKFAQCLKNDVRVRSMFGKMMFDNINYETTKTYLKPSFVFWLKQCEKILQQKPHIRIVLLWTNSRLSMSLSILSLASDLLHVRQHSANKEGISNRQIENLRGFKIKPYMTENPKIQFRTFDWMYKQLQIWKKKWLMC